MLFFFDSYYLLRGDTFVRRIKLSIEARNKPHPTIVIAGTRRSVLVTELWSVYISRTNARLRRRLVSSRATP